VLRNQARQTVSFWADEVKGAKETLRRLDTEVTIQRTENQGGLPERVPSNLQALNALQLQMASVKRDPSTNGQKSLMW